MAGLRRQGPSNSPEIVTSSARCQQIVRALLQKKAPVAVDAEGVRLGPKGPLTLLQVGTYDGQVYLFDVHQNKSLFTEGQLKDLLEAKDVVKVIHSCSGDSGALYFQFDVRLQNVFDTQVAHICIDEHVNGVNFPKKLKLELLTEKYGGPPNPAKKLQEEWRFITDYWARRPLTKQMVDYAAGDVTCLVPKVYQNLKKILEEKGLCSVLQQCVEEEILVCIEPEVVKENKNKRRQEKLSRIIRELERKYNGQVPNVEQLPENQLEALKFIRGTDDFQERSLFARELRKKRMLYDLDKWETAFRRDRKKFKLERVEEITLSEMCDHEDMVIRSKARSLQKAIEDDKLNKIIWKRGKNFTLATHEKFLIMKLPDERLNPRLREIRQDLARECETEITRELVSVRDLESQKSRLSKTQRALLKAIPDNLIRGHELKRLKRQIEADREDEDTQD